MSRPVGSKNKPKVPQNRNGVFLTKFEKQIEGSAITKKSGLGYVMWGIKNNFPNLMLDLYNQSPTHAACVNFCVQSIIGEGIDFEASKFDGREIVPNPYEDWNSLLRSVCLDYALYNSYAIQCILSRDGTTMYYYHMPLDKVRWTEYDEDGQITKFMISNDWSEVGANPPFEIDAFDMRPDTKIEKGKPYLYVYRPYSPAQTYYTTPKYTPAIKAIQSEIEYLQFDLKNITNSFTPAGVLTLPECETEEEKQAIIDNVTKMFVGTSNANSLLINFRSNIEGNNVEFVPFAKSQGSFNFFQDANERCINRILSAWQINDPQLIGLPQQGSNGFNSEGKFLETAYNVYNRVVGNYNRQCVIQTFNFMLALNGIKTELVMKPLRFDIENSESTSSSSSRDNTSINEKDMTEEKIEEKKDGNNVKEN